MYLTSSSSSHGRSEEYEGVLEDSFEFTRSADRTVCTCLSSNTEWQYLQLFITISKLEGVVRGRSISKTISTYVNEIQDNKWLLHAYNLTYDLNGQLL